LSVAEERERLALRHSERKLQASERLFARAHEVLKESMKNSRPSDSARMFVVAALLGDQALGLGGGTTGAFGLNPAVAPIINVVIKRDAQSRKVKEYEDEFFRRHPEIRRPRNGLENAEIVNETGLPELAE
jgi:hypothetical protein